MSSPKYWIRNSGKVEGPFDSLQVRGLLVVGRLTPTMEISTDAVHWHVAGQVKGLFPAQAPSVDASGSLVHVNTKDQQHSSAPMEETGRPKRWRKAVKTRIVAISAGAAVAAVIAYFAFSDDDGLSCSSQQVVTLATSIIYEDMAKRSNDIQLAAARGLQVTKADLTAMEGRFRNAATIDLTGVSTIDHSGHSSRCEATLRIIATAEGRNSDLGYFGETYSDGEQISYSVAKQMTERASLFGYRQRNEQTCLTVFAPSIMPPYAYRL